MTSHFNALTEAEQERLAILIEECGEVIQASCKILRHGYSSTNKGKLPETNREALERELGDLFHVYERLRNAGDVNGIYIAKRASGKAERTKPYLHHQMESEKEAAKEGK